MPTRLRAIVLMPLVGWLVGCVTAPDPHRTEAGFFDLHVCHWPDRPFFYKAVFSSFRFDDLESVRVETPSGQPLIQFNLDHYRTVRKPGKPVKRIYLADLAVPDGAASGWYVARIRTRDGRDWIARDHLILRRLGMVQDPVQPANESTETAPPTQLSWSPAPDARFYVVYLYDRWEDNRLIWESPPVSAPRVALPPGKVLAGGSYLWRVHARDNGETAEFGDFNHGSLSAEFSFSVQDPP